ncbi:MAG: hypothetical protein GY754_18455 [bacterium]|nr:hypothetical protein [bacterium]
MKEHLYFIYILSSFGAGVLSLVLAGIIRYKKIHTLKYYIPFFLSFTLKLFTGVILVYILCNLPGLHFYVSASVFILNILSNHLLTIFTPIFIHHFFSVPYGKKANIIFINISITVALILIIGMSTFSFKFSEAEHLVFLYKPVIISHVILILVMIYSLTVSIIYFKKIESPKRRDGARGIIIIVLLGYPGIFYELLSQSMTVQLDKMFLGQFWFPPTLYLVWSLFSIYYFIKYYFLNNNKDINVEYFYE